MKNKAWHHVWCKDFTLSDQQQHLHVVPDDNVQNVLCALRRMYLHTLKGHEVTTELIFKRRHFSATGILCMIIIHFICEYCDMYLMFSECNGNVLQTTREYACWYLSRSPPNAKIICSLNERLWNVGNSVIQSHLIRLLHFLKSILIAF